MVDHSSMLLGRKPYRPDPRTLKLGAYLRALPPFPSSVQPPPYSRLGAMRNDALSDCTAAAKGHLIQGWTAANDAEVIPTDDQVVDFYAASTGYVRGDASTDQGGDMILVLNTFRTRGLAGHKCGAYVELEPGNHEHVKASIYYFGGIDVAVNLPLSAQKQDVWKMALSGLQGDPTPNSWGGHDVPIVGYNETGPICVSWGRLVQMVWSWFDLYCEVGFAILSTDWVRPGKAAPNGILLDNLQADLQIVAAS